MVPVEVEAADGSGSDKKVGELFSSSEKECGPTEKQFGCSRGVPSTTITLSIGVVSGPLADEAIKNPSSSLTPGGGGGVDFPT